jgi:hypothetical protein
MKITISSAIKADHNEVRDLVRRGFRGERGADVEVHVKGSWREEFIPNPDGRLCRFRDGTSARGRFLRLQGEFHGRAYTGVPTIAKTGEKARYLVVINMPVRPDELRHRYPKEHKDSRAKSMPTYVIASWQDNLVKTAAHEAYHVTQFRRGLPHSEVECERHAVHVLTGQRCNHPRRRTKRALMVARAAEVAGDVRISS